jgi:cobalamin biosynthesis protein CbiD
MRPNTFAPRIGTHEKAARIFNQAKTAYEKGHRYYAMQTARYALHVARKSGEYCKAYLYGFLAMLKWELGQYKLAAYYCRQAMQSLWSYHADYRNDKKYYESMLKAIEDNMPAAAQKQEM